MNGTLGTRGLGLLTVGFFCHEIPIKLYLTIHNLISYQFEIEFQQFVETKIPRWLPATANPAHPAVLFALFW